MISVYDEINGSAPKARAKEEMAILRECMEHQRFDLDMLTDGKLGANWHEAKKYVEETSPWMGLWRKAA